MSKPVWSLVSYFSYHKGMKMSQRNDDTDKVILGRTLSRRLDQGYTPESLKGMIDRFYQSYGKDYSLPALAFVSKPMQEKLTHEADVVKDDPILQWLLNGMPDRGPFDEPREMRKAVILAGDAINRYPDVVADILRIEGTYAATSSRLAFLDQVIGTKINRGGHTPMGFPDDVIFPVARLLPPELRGAGPIRPRHDTVQAAIAALPIKRSR